MKRTLRIFGFLFVTLIWTACSNQWRETQTELDGQALDQFVRATINAGSSSSGMVQFQQMYEKPNTRIYFSEGPSPEFGSPEGATPIYDWSFLGSEYSNLSISTDVERSQVYLLELLDEQGSMQAALAVDLLLKEGKGRIVKTFHSVFSADLTGGEMALQMAGETGQNIVLRSFDVTSEELLADVVQLEVYILGAQESYVGKVSSLVSFD